VTGSSLSIISNRSAFIFTMIEIHTSKSFITGKARARERERERKGEREGNVEVSETQPPLPLGHLVSTLLLLSLFVWDFPAIAIHTQIKPHTSLSTFDCRLNSTPDRSPCVYLCINGHQPPPTHNHHTKPPPAGRVRKISRPSGTFFPMTRRRSS
jgi:hypothetical protein